MATRITNGPSKGELLEAFGNGQVVEFEFEGLGKRSVHVKELQYYGGIDWGLTGYSMGGVEPGFEDAPVCIRHSDVHWYYGVDYSTETRTGECEEIH